MLDNILQISNRYATGLEHVMRRRTEWIEKHEEVHNHLKEIADFLNEKSTYKQPFYVDKSHAFNEDINGTCKQIPSVTFRAGSMPMHVTFKNNAGDLKDYEEEGFRITFSPTITGQIIVLIHPHFSNLDAEVPQFRTMAVINEPNQINNEILEQIIEKGMELAFFTSFTGLAEARPSDGTQGQYHPNPIGFKKYESTENRNQPVSYNQNLQNMV